MSARRAREADTRASAEDANKGPSGRAVATKSSTSRKRKGGQSGGRTGFEDETVSEEEATLLEKVAALVAESSSMGGRDAPVIIADADELKKTIMDHDSLTRGGRKKMLDQLEELNSSLALENMFEQKCGRFLQVGLMVVTFVPMLLTSLEGTYEFVSRPTMVVEPAELFNKHAVVTGGCGALGLDLAIMLANSGAGVVIGCHHDAVQVESHLSKLGLLRSRDSQEASQDGGWIAVWPLQLESFKSVREFAARIARTVGVLDILVHNAATKEGCTRTEDGHELVTQVNYLSPFLLTHLLLPKMRTGSARVVHVTCEAGLQQPDWLPWPMGRTQAELLPQIDLEGLEQRRHGSNCSSFAHYGNSKLAIVVHSHELNRRISDYQGVSHVVDPGSMDSAFGHTVPSAPSMRSSMMGNLPPVWIAKKIYSVTLGPAVSSVGNFMLRSTSHGAKAVFHVATAAELGSEENGGGLFSDRAGPFIDCGKPRAQCGRVELHKQPVAATDEDRASQLWDATEIAIGRQHLRALDLR